MLVMMTLHPTWFLKQLLQLRTMTTKNMLKAIRTIPVMQCVIPVIKIEQGVKHRK